MQRIDLQEVWKDKKILGEMRSEIKKQSIQGWKPWEILLPPDLLYPMIEEVSSGMMIAWSPCIDNVGINVGEQNEVAIRFVLKDMKVSSVMVKTMKYIPSKIDDIILVTVN